MHDSPRYTPHAPHAPNITARSAPFVSPSSFTSPSAVPHEPSSIARSAPSVLPPWLRSVLNGGAHEPDCSTWNWPRPLPLGAYAPSQIMYVSPQVVGKVTRDVNPPHDAKSLLHPTTAP